MKPNYSIARLERERKKAAKKMLKQQQKKKNEVVNDIQNDNTQRQNSDWSIFDKIIDKDNSFL